MTAANKRPYAADTSVPVERSRGEIERTLERFGATSFAYERELFSERLAFQLADRRIAFQMTMPSRQDRRFTHTPTGQPRGPKAAAEAWEQERMRRWRSLANGIKATLAMVDDGILTAEQAFWGNVLLPGTGESVFAATAGYVAQVYGQPAGAVIALPAPAAGR